MTNAEEISTFLAHINHDAAAFTARNNRQRMNKWEAFFGDRDPATVTSKDLGDWIKWLLDVLHNKPQYVKDIVQTAKRFFVWLEDQDRVPRDYAERIFRKRRLPKLVPVVVEQQAISEADHLRLMEYLRRPGVPAKRYWITACLIAWHTGLRISDISFLKWEQIDWTTGVLRATPVKTRRRGRVVELPMADELVAHLKELFQAPDYPSVYVLPDMAGYYKLDRSLISSQFAQFARAAGVGGLHAHSYRHGFVSRLANAGVLPLVISSMTGHSVRQVETYCHVSEDAKREAFTAVQAAQERARNRHAND